MSPKYSWEVDKQGDTENPEEKEKQSTPPTPEELIQGIQAYSKGTRIFAFGLISLLAVMLLVVYLSLSAGITGMRKQLASGNQRLDRMTAVVDSIQRHPAQPVAKNDSAGIARLLEEQGKTRALEEQTAADVAQLREEFNRQYLRSK